MSNVYSARLSRRVHSLFRDRNILTPKNNMIIFEKLRPFVWMCQLFGVFPFFMEMDLQTKLFKKFSFSWKKPVTWWFVFISIGQFFFLCLDIYLAWELCFREGTMQNLPTIFPTIFFLEHIYFLVLIVMTRYIMSKYSHIRLAITHIQKVHNIFYEKVNFVMKEQSVKRHVVAGLILPLITTIGLVVSVAAQVHLLADRYGTIFAIIFPIGWFFLVTSAMSSIFCIYLSNFVVASYIHVIALSLHRPEFLSPLEMGLRTKLHDREEIIPKTIWMDKLSKSKKGFSYLCSAMTELNHALSWPILILIFLRLLSTAFCLYATLYGFLVSESNIIRKFAPGMASIALIGLLGILIIFRAADLPTHQVKHLRETIFAISSVRKFDMEEGIEVLTLVQQLSEDRVQLSAAGLFNVGMHLLPSLTGSIMTYLVILLQSQLA